MQSTILASTSQSPGLPTICFFHMSLRQAARFCHHPPARCHLLGLQHNTSMALCSRSYKWLVGTEADSCTSDILGRTALGPRTLCRCSTVQRSIEYISVNKGDIFIWGGGYVLVGEDNFFLGRHHVQYLLLAPAMCVIYSWLLGSVHLLLLLALLSTHNSCALQVMHSFLASVCYTLLNPTICMLCIPDLCAPYIMHFCLLHPVTWGP